MKPNEDEKHFLTYAYNFFYNVHQEIIQHSFWDNRDPYYRLSKVKDVFLVYSEILEYEPITWFVEQLRKLRPPMEAELSKEFILFIRNVLVHFPFFESWDEIEISKRLINWSKPGKSIDKFLTKYAGHEVIKYRMWDANSKTMVYFQISFPPSYTDTTIIKLKDIIPEREGVLFIISLIFRVLASQVEDVKE